MWNDYVVAELSRQRLAELQDDARRWRRVELAAGPRRAPWSSRPWRRLARAVGQGALSAARTAGGHRTA